jgi:hypothetical protein
VQRIRGGPDSAAGRESKVSSRRRRGVTSARLLLTAALVLPAVAVAQQVADPAFNPRLAAPTYQPDEGPLVLIDEAHHNFHTAAGRYRPFTDLLLQDGYRVAPLSGPITAAALNQARILVIANPLHADNIERWSRPTPAAFADDEVQALTAWVNQGGALLLIADHMPFPGAAANVAAAFGISFSNGFAMRPDPGGPDLFTRDAGTLLDHAVTEGRTDADRVERIASFTGSAFECISRCQPVMRFSAGYESLEPEQAWQFREATPRKNIEGWFQGATLTVGKGRVAVFGEAAMFTAQLAGPNRLPVGMNAPAAAENPRFLLNILRWLAPPPSGASSGASRRSGAIP